MSVLSLGGPHSAARGGVLEPASTDGAKPSTMGVWHERAEYPRLESGRNEYPHHSK